jgi:hypothetical protein
MARARDIVSRNRDALSKVAARLLAVEVIEGDELRRILTEAGAAVPPRRPPPADPAPRIVEDAEHVGS